MIDAIKKVIRFEGGYVNDPYDSGGETYKGISRKFNPNWKGWEIIDSIEDKSKLDENKELEKLVVEFYFSLFRDSLSNVVYLANEKLGINYFDAVVNMGRRAAVEILQESINSFGEELKVDGVLGKKTILALNRVKDKDIVNKFKEFRVKRYIKIAKKNPKNLKFLLGWVNRAFEV